MSQDQNVAYLDFPDQKRSLSFDSFCENGQRALERYPLESGMCICVELADAGTLLISWNGLLHKELNLPGGSHKLLLEANIPEGAGELTLEVIVDGRESGEKRAYRLVSDYMLEYSEYMFRVFRDQREAQRLNRLRMQCPAPHEGQTLASLTGDKYDAASREVEQVHRSLGNLHAIDLAHMFHISQSLGDSQDRRNQIDSALSGLCMQLHKALQSLENISLNVEHARYYHDQQHAGDSPQAS
jgi:hypothetical protein